MSDVMRRDPATPDEIWAILRQVAEGQQETRRQMQETDRQMLKNEQRMQEEADRQMQETEETDLRLMNETDDPFSSPWDDLMEFLEGNLTELLRSRGVDPDHTGSRLKRKCGASRWEIDLFAANAEEFVAVEVRTTLDVAQVASFVEKLKTFAVEAPTVYRGKRLYGAVAFVRADESSAVYAEKQGLFVIRATGSSASIVNAEGFRPRTFG